MVTKWDWTNSKPSISIQLTNSKLRVGWGYGTGQTRETFDTATISANTKYHVVVTLDGVNKICYVWVYNLSTAVLSYTPRPSRTPCGLSMLTSASGQSCNGNYFNGVIDEVVVLNRMVNEIEAIKLRSGAYSGESQLDALAVQAYVEYQEESETKIPQVVAEVEWVPTDPNTHLYAGSIGIGITLQGSYDPVWEKAGSVPIGITPPGEYFLRPARRVSVSRRNRYLHHAGCRSMPGGLPSAASGIDSLHYAPGRISLPGPLL